MLKSSFFLLTSMRKIPVKKHLPRSEVFSEPLPSKTSSDFVNEVSNTQKPIIRPSRDVTAAMKACISLESFDLVFSKTLSETDLN